MNMIKFGIIYNDSHPLSKKLREMENSYLYIDNFDFKEIQKYSIVFDLTLLNDHEKEKWLEQLLSHTKVISDTTCNWGQYLASRFSEERLIAQMATAFYSPKAVTEVYLSPIGDQSFKISIEYFLEKLSLQPLYINEVGHAFTYPRTLSTLINEAYYALEDQLATKEDMDQAMRFGVSYPHGPFEWAQKIGLKPIIMLLDSLYQQSGDSRYAKSPLIKLESLNA